jgi:hypothetical protein
LSGFSPLPSNKGTVLFPDNGTETAATSTIHSPLKKKKKRNRRVIKENVDVLAVQSLMNDDVGDSLNSYREEMEAKERMFKYNKRKEEERLKNRSIHEIRKDHVKDRKYNYLVGSVDVPIIRSYEDTSRNNSNSYQQQQQQQQQQYQDYSINNDTFNIGSSISGGGGSVISISSSIGGGYSQQYQQNKLKRKNSRNNVAIQQQSSHQQPRTRLLNYNTDVDALSFKRKNFKPPNSRAMIDVGVVIR